MKYELLGNIVDISKGKKHNPAEIPNENSKRIIGIDDLRNDTNITLTNDPKGVEACKNDVLIAWDGANAGTIGYGKKGYIGSTIARLRIKSNHQYSEVFLGKLLQSKFRYLRSMSTGATIPHVNRAALDSIKVPNFNIDEQIRIATVLTRAEKLIAKRKKSIKALDELLKSTFLEMFGDPASMLKQPIALLDDFIVFLTSGSRGWAQYYAETGDIFIRINNVKDACFKLDDLKYVIPPKNAEGVRTKVRKNDLLFSITADLGRTAVVDERLNGAYINQHLALIRLNQEKINPVFVAWYFAMPFGKSLVMKKNRVGVKAGLNFDDLRSFGIVTPSLRIQNQFAAIVERVESLKSKYTQSLTELENFYGSLSQRAFKGELDLSKISINQPKSTAQIKPNNIELFKRIPRPQFNERYRGNVPLLPLKIAAGGFSDQQIADWGDWAEIKTSQPIRKGWFVAQVVGDSMEPLIPKGSFCLFKPFFLKPHKDKILLIQQHEENDPETGGKYTLKMIEQQTDRDTSEIVEVRLVSLNPKYPPKIYHEDPHLKPVAEFAEVLGK